MNVSMLIGSGALSRRVHAGSMPSDQGCVGTNDPEVWWHLLWFDGQLWAAELKSDVLRHVPSYEELRSHFFEWYGTGTSPWRRIV